MGQLISMQLRQRVDYVLVISLLFVALNYLQYSHRKLEILAVSILILIPLAWLRYRLQRGTLINRSKWVKLLAGVAITLVGLVNLGDWALNRYTF